MRRTLAGALDTCRRRSTNSRPTQATCSTPSSISANDTRCWSPCSFGPSSAPLPSNPYAAKGYHILRQSLLLSCSQDIAKLCLDKDDRTPSIKNLVTPLTEVAVRDALRDEFSVWGLARTAEDDDPDIAAALQRIELREESERRTQFEDLLCELTDTWAALSKRPALDSFATIRDKLTAHTEVRYVADKYQLIDIESLGLKWQDLKDTIDLIGMLPDWTRHS